MSVFYSLMYINAHLYPNRNHGMETPVCVKYRAIFFKS